MKQVKLNFKEFLFALVKLTRPINSFMIGLATIIGMQISDSNWFNLKFLTNLGYVSGVTVTILAFFAAFLASSFSMVFNDYIDYKVDIINSPHKPIPAGKISREAALLYAILLALVSSLLSFIISYISFFIVISGLLISFLYNTYLKKEGLIGNIMVAYSTSLPFIYGASILYFSNFIPILILIMLALLSNISREIIKGIADIEGDKALGILTVANVHGKKFAVRLASFFIILAIISSIIPFIFKLLNLYYLIPILITDSIFIYATYILVKSQMESTALKSKNLYLVAMLITLIGFFIISYYE